MFFNDGARRSGCVRRAGKLAKGTPFSSAPSATMIHSGFSASRSGRRPNRCVAKYLAGVVDAGVASRLLLLIVQPGIPAARALLLGKGSLRLR